MPKLPSILVNLCLPLLASAGFGQAPPSHAVALSRAKEIVGKMTLDEKVGQMHGIRDGLRYRTTNTIPRLGVPELQMTNGPAGPSLGSGGRQQPATVMPSPTALAASWDIALARRYGAVIGTESLAIGNQLIEAPDMNIIRVPQNGRAFENFSEDPFLNSRMAVADVQGIQSVGEIANVKHFFANNQETNRMTVNEVIGERAMREIELPAFEASLKEGHAASIMCAYPRVNGNYVCENKPLLKDILQEWGFDGFVISDNGAVHSTVASMNAGLDFEFGGGRYYADPLKQAVQAGTVSEAAIDDALIRRFAKMMEFGLFGPKKQKPPTLDVLGDGKIAREIGEQSVVLLKNEKALLPLDGATIRKVALIGPYAVRSLAGGAGSADVLPTYTIEPISGIRQQLLPSGFGSRLETIDGNDLEAAAKLAKSSDVAIVMVGANQGEGSDHPIDLSPDQNKLIETVAAANPKTIVVLKTGSAITMPWIAKVAAVLEAWYPGQEDGNVVARVLFGEVNPSGKLPVTFPVSSQDTLARNPAQYPGNGKEVQYSEGINVGYRWYQTENIQPLFPFGFGLSYTTFAYSKPEVTALPGKAGVTVTFEIKNTGKVAGAEIAQVYVGFPKIDEGDEPPRQLKGFTKANLSPGESRTVHITLNDRAFSYWSTQSHKWVIAPGNYKIMIGASSADIRLEATQRLGLN